MSFYFIIKTSSRFNGFYLCFWFLSLFSFIWIGGQFPVDNFLSYGRILTLHYYLLIFWVRGLFLLFVLYFFVLFNSNEQKKDTNHIFFRCIISLEISCILRL